MAIKSNKSFKKVKMNKLLNSFSLNTDIRLLASPPQLTWKVKMTRLSSITFCITCMLLQRLHSQHPSVPLLLWNVLMWLTWWRTETSLQSPAWPSHTFWKHLIAFARCFTDGDNSEQTLSAVEVWKKRTSMSPLAAGRSVNHSRLLTNPSTTNIHTRTSTHKESM